MHRADSAALLLEASREQDAPRSAGNAPQLPVQPRVAGATMPTSRTAGAICLLAVDDDPVILQLLRAWLSRYQVEVQTAASGREAMERIERGEVHLLVTDLVMAGMDGIELLRRLARLPQRPRVLGISGASGGESLGMAFTAMGAEGFLLKPFDRDQFLAALQRVLGRELSLR